MRGAVLYGPRDVRFEERDTPKIVEPTDAIIRISLTCVCGSDLWPYRGLQPINGPTPMGHEYCGIVEEAGSAVTSMKPGQFVIVRLGPGAERVPHGLVRARLDAHHATARRGLDIGTVPAVRVGLAARRKQCKRSQGRC